MATATAQQLLVKERELEAARRYREHITRDYDTMIGRATGRLQRHEVHVYVHERPAFGALVRARGWA